MPPVGRERRTAFQHPHAHHPYRVEHGYRKHRERERNLRRHFRTVYARDDEVDHHRTHQQRAAVADEHLRGLSEDVVAQEREQRTDADKGKCRRLSVPGKECLYAECRTGEDAVARTESVHPIDQVHGVDDAHAREDGKTDGKPPRKMSDAPQPVEVIDTAPGGINQGKDCRNFHGYSRYRCQAKYVVRDTHAQHQRHDADHGIKPGDAGKNATDNHRGKHTDEHGHTAQYWNGCLLQLAAARLVRDVLLDADPKNVPVDHTG